MAELSESAYEDKFNNVVTGLLKDNNNKEIVPSRHRTQVTDTKDSFLNVRTWYGSYIRPMTAYGTNAYTGTMTLSQSTALSAGAFYLIVFENSSTAAASVTINGFTRKVYLPSGVQAGNGDLIAGVPYQFWLDPTLDSAIGGLRMVSGGTSSGGVTDGDKTGVQVSGSGTIWLPSDYINTTVSTAGSTITLPHGSKYESFFTGLTSFSTPKDVVRTNEERTMRWTFMWEVTDLAATLDFGSDTRSSSEQFASGVFTPLDVGAYKVVATRRYDDIWWLDFRGVYSVGDTPPTPADLWVLSTGIWNNSEFWDNDAIWKDEV